RAARRRRGDGERLPLSVPGRRDRRAGAAPLGDRDDGARRRLSRGARRRLLVVARRARGTLVGGTDVHAGDGAGPARRALRRMASRGRARQRSSKMKRIVLAVFAFALAWGAWGAPGAPQPQIE